MLGPAGHYRASARFFSAFFEWSQISGTRLASRTCSVHLSARQFSGTGGRPERRRNVPARISTHSAARPGASSGKTWRDTTTAKVVLSGEHLRQLQNERTLKELRQVTGCDFEIGTQDANGTPLFVSGSASDVRLAMQCLSRSLGSEGVAEKQHIGRGHNLDTSVDTEAPAVDNARAEGSPKTHKSYEVVEVTTSIDVPRDIAMLFPIKESALPSKSAASFKYAQTPRQVVRSIVAGRPPKQPIQITGNPDQVDHMVNRIKKLVERTASKAPSPESDDPILPSGKGTWKPFRHFMRSVVNPVAILTTRLPNEPFNSEERFLGCRGTTISSLTSVTLQPAPVITFNLHAESRTAQKLEHAGYCDIHLLSSSAAGVDIAQPFAATKGLSLLEPFRIVDGLEHAHIDIQDDGAVYINSPGVLAHLRCRMIEGKTVRIGDHKVMFCEVVEAVRRSTETDYSWADITEPLHETCLTYADRKYGTMHSPSHLTSTPVPIDTTNTTSTGGSDQASPHQQDSARSMNYDHIKAQTDQMLNQILAKENAKASSSSTIACSATTRQFSTSAIHHPFPPCRRRYSTRAAPDPQQPDRIPPSSPDFLKQTVATFLAYDSFPKGRWVNDRWIRELQDCGPGRVQLAIRGGQPDAPDDGRPGGKRNARDMRIRKLIEHLHRAQKNGHVDDSVMQELVLGKGARGLDGKM